MKRFFALCVLGIVFATAAGAAGLDTQKLVPDGCVAVITVANIQADPGISWMLDTWLKSEKKSSLKDLLKAAAPQEMSVAFFPETAGKPMNVLIILASPKTPDKARLEGVLTEGGEAKLETKTYKGTSITFNAGKSGKAESNAFAVYKDKIILGADSDIIQKAIDGPYVSDSPNYQKIVGQSAQARDALLFADNAGSKFALFLAPREKKWNMTLLLAAEYLAYLGSSFDVVNSSKVTGSIVFQAADKGRIADIKDDAEFIGEAFKRKFIAEKIQYTGTVEVKDLTVKLTFQIEGLEPLWRKLFDKGVLDLFKPEP